MELVCTYPITTHLAINAREDMRFGALSVKITYQVGPDGRVAIERDAPKPILLADETTELGVAPRDDGAHELPVFEVIFLGAAYAPGGRPSRRFDVSLTVGPVTRQIAVFGRRVWQGAGEDAEIATVGEVRRLPISPRYAFGGNKTVSIDEKSVLPIFYPFNHVGRGFDPTVIIEGLARELIMPAGFPRWDPTRRLPNLEDPAALIRHWHDEPRPLFWSALPMQSMQAMEQAMGLDLRRISGEDIELPDVESVATGMALRAHPAWRIATPPPAAPVTLRNLTPEGELGFALPTVAVLADYHVGDRTGTLEVPPQRLVIHGEEKRFSVLYRRIFNFAAGRKETRSIRLRLVTGWPGMDRRTRDRTASHAA